MARRLSAKASVFLDALQARILRLPLNMAAPPVVVSSCEALMDRPTIARLVPEATLIGLGTMSARISKTLAHQNNARHVCNVWKARAHNSSNATTRELRAVQNALTC